MRIKISMHYMCEYFGVEKMEIRLLFSELLGSDVLNSLETRFPNLGMLACATDEDLLSITGIGEKTLKDIKDVIGAFFKKLVLLDELTDMPKDIQASKRIRYGELIDSAELFSCSIKKIDKAIEKLPKKEAKYVKMAFGLDKKKRLSPKQISEKLDIPLCEIDEYRIKVLRHLSDVIHSKS